MTIILIPRETSDGERRVSATPETIKKLINKNCQVFIEESAGELSGFSDIDYKQVGATIYKKNDIEAWGEADIVLCVQMPEENFLRKMKEGSLLIGLLAPYGNNVLKRVLNDKKILALSLELLPRISRAQSSDALSSQANIAGYKAVLIAASALDRYFPMLMTAAGTVQPAKVIVLGGGVAGLQAVATAKRLGAVVFVSDIRESVKEQVESLGARFIELPKIEKQSSESGGYAQSVSEEFLKEQRKILSDKLAESDVAICTAQVPGKKAPVLINLEMLDRMRKGSVVVDLAVSQGGNCEGTKSNETVARNGIKLIGASDLPSSVPNHASNLYSKNLFSLISPFINDGSLEIDFNDELISGSLLTKDGNSKIKDIFELGGGF